MAERIECTVLAHDLKTHHICETMPVSSTPRERRCSLVSADSSKKLVSGMVTSSFVVDALLRRTRWCAERFRRWRMNANTARPTMRIPPVCESEYENECVCERERERKYKR